MRASVPSVQPPSDLEVAVHRAYRSLERRLGWKPLALLLALLVSATIWGTFFRSTSHRHGIQTAPPGTPEATPSGQEKLEMPVYHNNVGPLGIRPQDVSSLDAAQKVKLAEEILALDEKAITPKEQDRRDAETKLKKDKEAEESEKARVKKDEDEAEIDKLTEKSWEWMRDHAVELREEDFLIALSSRAEHLDVIRASRKWRQGMRTVVGLDREATHMEELEASKHNEMWLYYPGEASGGSRASAATRSAMMPVLAHKAAGNDYRWLLYGEEDTVFFVDAVQHLLKSYDWHLPYTLTDRGTRKPTALRCMPCHAPASMDPPPAEGYVFGFKVKKKPFQGIVPRGCPCKPQLLCEKDPNHSTFNVECDFPTQPGNAYSVQKGSGMILSQGLMEELKSNSFERCVQSDHAAGSHEILSSCLWEAGHAHTDPSILLPNREQDLFDISASKATLALASALDKTCDAACQDLITNMISAHISIKTSGPEASAHTIESLARLYSLVIHARPRTNVSP
ncbi:hypothetical protein WJX84_008420 [Apatococcus fuscideae]|uniref:Uncharacterized protein n=1 Tax=Apatococcus fuscideae TaxID=2026836 RepID=A0AAW1RY84_9CHLO